MRPGGQRRSHAKATERSRDRELKPFVFVLMLARFIRLGLTDRSVFARNLGSAS